MKTRYWIAAFLTMALLLGGALLWQRLGARAQRYAEVLVDGVSVCRVDLSVEQTFTVQGVGGSNVLRVENGTIRVLQADCPGNDCVHRGAANSGTPIICLPHRLVIRFTDSGGIDGMAGS